MKKFLMPYCRVCRIGFKSPMLYENHICSLDHLKVSKLLCVLQMFVRKSSHPVYNLMSQCSICVHVLYL